MKKLTFHKWTPVEYAFRTWRCHFCGCVKHWDQILQRMVYVWHDKHLYRSPRCHSSINGEPVFANKQFENRFNQ